MMDPKTGGSLQWGCQEWRSSRVSRKFGEVRSSGPQGPSSGEAEDCSLRSTGVLRVIKCWPGHSPGESGHQGPERAHQES